MDKDRAKHPELECAYTFNWDAEVGVVMDRLVYYGTEELTITDIYSGYTIYVPTKDLLGEEE